MNQLKYGQSYGTTQVQTLL